jgi:hypothetical protein
MADPFDVTAMEDVIPNSDGGTDKSLSSVLDAALDRHTEPTPPAAPAAPTAAPSRAAPDAAAATGETGQPRDPFGKFAPKAPPAGAPTPQQGAPGAAPGTNGAAGPHDEAPQSWKVENRALWGKIPADVRPYLHQREQELQYGFQQVAQRASVAEGVLNEFLPYAEQLQKEGATPITAIRTLLQTAHQLRSGGPQYRKALILSLADQYGVDLSEPVNMELARAEAVAANLTTEKMYGSAQQAAQINQQTFGEFQAFANDPQNEFFPQVRGIMARLIESNIAPNLRTAYDMAVGMHSDVRTTLIDRETKKAMQAQKQNGAANLSVQGGPGGPTGGAVNAGKAGESVRATLDRVLAGA